MVVPHPVSRISVLDVVPISLDQIAGGVASASLE
jgi:hypothetical protein